ncbi:MAG: energy transducer TonB [Paludibacteraceae bacterium]|nr:energy transducer TonB [Paludibacteraceae bacterium]
MEIKKSPKADIENSKSTSLLIGLTVAMGILFAAFEWSQSEIKIYDEALQNVVEEDEEMVEVTFRDETPPPPPPPEPETVLSDVYDIKENTEEVQTADFSTEDDANKGVEIHEVVQQVEEEEPEEQKIHLVVEKMPEFPGGNDAMNRWLSKNIKYPLIAQENGIQGRVVCQFVVNSDGKIVDVQVVRGVEASLDAEAVRVIKSMPAWTPGRQGGKNVRVKYTLPIRFKL